MLYNDKLEAIPPLHRIYIHVEEPKSQTTAVMTSFDFLEEQRYERRDGNLHRILGAMANSDARSEPRERERRLSARAGTEN